MKLRQLTIIMLTTLLAVMASAEQKTELDDYELHYIVLNTTELPADIAENYGITRSGKRAFINLSLLQKSDDGVGRPVSTDIRAQQRTLLGQLAKIELREIREGSAIYYIGSFRIFDQETLWFDIDLTLPDGVSRTFSFSQQVWQE